MAKDIKYGHVKVEDTGTAIRLHVGNCFRDLSVTYARSLAGIIRSAADKLAGRKLVKTDGTED